MILPPAPAGARAVTEIVCNECHVASVLVPCLLPAVPAGRLRRSASAGRAHRRAQRARGRSGHPGAGQRDSHRVLGADGHAWPHPVARHGAVCAHQSSHPRHLPLVGHDHSDLHARSEAAAALRNDLYGHHRHDGRRREYAPAGAGRHLQVHHADREALADQLVSARRHRQRRDGRAAALQSTGSRARPRGPPDGRTRPARVHAAVLHARRRGAAHHPEPRGAHRLCRQGGRGATGGIRHRRGAAAPDHLVGPAALSPSARPGGARDHNARAAGKLGEVVGRSAGAVGGWTRDTRRGPGLHDRSRAGVLPERLRMPRAVQRR